MKTFMAVTLSLLFMVAIIVTGVNAQNSDSNGAKDLYLSYGNNNHTQGRPGSKVSIELERDGKVSYVSPKFKFRSGDRIRLHLNVNYNGYIAVSNIGSTKKVSQLFPYPGANSQVTPTTDYPIPQGNNWIRFDDNPGTETVIVVMSSEPMREVPASDANASPEPAPSSNGNSNVNSNVNVSEALQALNSRALSNSKDLVLELNASDNNCYAVSSSNQSIAKPVGFRLELKHAGK